MRVLFIAILLTPSIIFGQKSFSLPDMAYIDDTINYQKYKVYLVHPHNDYTVSRRQKSMVALGNRYVNNVERIIREQYVSAFDIYLMLEEKVTPYPHASLDTLTLSIAD